MKENIETYFKHLIDKYGSEVSLTDSDNDNQKLEQVPVALHALYQFTAKADLPFGRIFDINQALIESERSPFKPDWFVFGQDTNSFSFWLCSFNVDEEGLSFTEWDHGSGTDIGGAVFRDIASLLADIEEEEEERERLEQNRNEYSVSSASCSRWMKH